MENEMKRNCKATFTEINLSDLQRKKVPKRLVYFSDGVLEEYSTDEDETDYHIQDKQSLVDPKTLPWLPYFAYLAWLMGSRTLAVCDYLGENLAWIFGITSPKFQYELEQFEKMEKEEEERKNTIQSENAGWCIMDEEEKQLPTIAEQPESNSVKSELMKQDVELSLLMGGGKPNAALQNEHV